MIDVICVYVYGGMEEGGHSCNDVVLCVDVTIREFNWAESRERVGY